MEYQSRFIISSYDIFLNSSIYLLIHLIGEHHNLNLNLKKLSTESTTIFCFAFVVL